MKHSLSTQDLEIYQSIQSELHRQTNTLELIASENFTSPAVMEAVGSILTNKYAEGYPGKRYYGGCEEVDKAENIARERLKNYIMPPMQMYSHIQVHKLTWVCI